MVVDLTPRKGPEGIAFRNDETAQELVVVVHDKFPQMGDVHIEGRRFVEVSVEMFVELMAAQGFHTVDPREIPFAAAEELTKDGE
jgi:hypothetical protein